MKINAFAQKSLLLAINSSYERVIKKINFDLKEYGCNFLQSLILISISVEKDGPVTPSKIAETFKTSKSNVSHAISSLENNKLVKRKTSGLDARVWEISLTAKGEKIINKLIQKIDQYENLFEDTIGKKQSSLLIGHLNIIYTEADSIGQ